MFHIIIRGMDKMCTLALQVRLMWEERVCSKCRASAQVDPKRLQSWINTNQDPESWPRG